MKRIEIIANRSVQSDIIEGLEQSLNDFCYTLLPDVHGKGKQIYHMGTATWPEVNFMLISFLADEEAEIAFDVIKEIKSHFPGEGIKFFSLNA
jgi:nitrogen regulatory protein PII